MKYAVQIAAYGKGFVKASQDTWEMFVKREMTEVVDSDITSAICFLTGVCSGSICTIVVCSWTYTVHRGYLGTLAALSAFIGYLMVTLIFQSSSHLNDSKLHLGHVDYLLYALLSCDRQGLQWHCPRLV